jgi:hypothetical protein
MDNHQHHRYPHNRSHQPQQQLQQPLSRRTIGNLRTTAPLLSQPKAVPALLKSGKADFGEDYIESQRRNRFGRNGGIRAQSEIGETLSNGGSSRLNASYYQHRREGSYNDDDRRPLGAVRSTSYYERPQSSFEPSSRSHHSSNATAAPRIVHTRQDDWQEVEQRRQQNQYSSEDEYLDDEEIMDSAESDELREELERYNRRGGGNFNTSQQPYGNSGGMRMSTSYSNIRQHRQDFDENDICFFGMLKLTPQKARQFITMKEPPAEFWSLSSVEKAAYLYYFGLYKQYITPVNKFHKIFNREFYKYTADGDTDDVALLKICKHTRDEYDLRRQRLHKEAYDRSRQHLFSDDRATPDSRATSYCEQLDESDITSIDSGAKEPHRFTKPHALASFAVGGKLLILNPEYSISTIQLVDVKKRIHDRGNLRNIDAMENFKGPLIIGETPSHTPLLFIERQINNIRNSEIYRQNPLNSDANDVLLIWRLLEMLIRQHGNVTGPDLARLLTENYSFSSPIKPIRGRVEKEQFLRSNENGGDRTESPMYAAAKDERRIDARAMDRFTQFLLGGYIDEAIESAISDGLFADALILAYRMFGNDRRKIEQIEAKLLSYRDPQHPSLTLLSVASNTPVPILSNMSSTDDTSAWRAHIAIVLANLINQPAMVTVHQLGLALSRKEFNAAADFCFLAVNLLTQFDCFAPIASQQSEDEEPFRRHITLINASLPDDEYYSTKTRYGWSILDFQATEIYDFALKMSQRPIVGGLTTSIEYQKCRLEYAQMLAEYGGAATSAFKYCSSIATCVYDNAHKQSASMLNDLCDLADRLHCAANQTPQELWWVPRIRQIHHQQQQQQFRQRNDSLQMSDPIQYYSVEPAMIPSQDYSAFSQPLTIVQEQSEPPPQQQPQLQQQQQSSPQHFLYQQPLQQQQQYRQRNDSLQMSDSILTKVLEQSESPQQQQQQYRQRNDSLQMSDPILTKVLEQSESPQQQQPSSPQHFLYQQPQQQQQYRQTNDSLQMSDPILTKVLEQSESHQQQQQSSPQQFLYQQPQQQQQQYRQRNDSLQMSDPIKYSSVEPAMIPSQDYSAFSQPLTKFQEQSEPPPQQQQQSSTNQPPQQQSKKQQQKGGGGFFSGLTQKLVKLVPSGNEMKLPDDSKKTIYWDESLGRYVGEGVEEEVAPPPPPSMSSMMPAAAASMPDARVPVTSPSSSSIGNAGGSGRPVNRRSATSRYANSFASATSPTPSANISAPEGFGMMPPPMPPTFGGFIPTIPDDENGEDEGANPFSTGPSQPSNSS